MSRIGKKPVPLASGVTVDIQGRSISVSGSKGTLRFEHPEGIGVECDKDKKILTVTRQANTSQHRAFHGLTRALLNNMVIGVSQGYSRKMEIYGTGYNCSIAGSFLELNVGYSHSVKLAIPEGIQVDIVVAATRGDETPAKLTISGIDKQVVGQFARMVKDARPPEPYKGKGIRYEGEQIRRKAGKAFAGTGGA